MKGKKSKIMDNNEVMQPIPIESSPFTIDAGPSIPRITAGVARSRSDTFVVAEGRHHFQ